MSSVDRGVLDDFLTEADNDVSLLEFVLASFAERAPVLVADLVAAIERSDRPAAAGYAHDLASLSGQVGARELAEPARVLEWVAERTDEPLAGAGQLLAGRVPAVLREIETIRADLAQSGSSR